MTIGPLHLNRHFRISGELSFPNTSCVLKQCLLYYGKSLCMISRAESIILCSDLWTAARWIKSGEDGVSHRKHDRKSVQSVFTHIASPNVQMERNSILIPNGRDRTAATGTGYCWNSILFIIGAQSITMKNMSVWYRTHCPLDYTLWEICRRASRWRRPSSQCTGARR